MMKKLSALLVFAAIVLGWAGVAVYLGLNPATAILSGFVSGVLGAMAAMRVLFR